MNANGPDHTGHAHAGGEQLEDEQRHARPRTAGRRPAGLATVWKSWSSSDSWLNCTWVIGSSRRSLPMVTVLVSTPGRCTTKSPSVGATRRRDAELRSPRPSPTVRSRSTSGRWAGSSGTPGTGWPELPTLVPGAIPTSRATPSSWADGPVSWEPLGPIQMSTGTDDCWIWRSSVGVGRVGHDDPAAVGLEHQRLGLAGLGVAHRLAHRVRRARDRAGRSSRRRPRSRRRVPSPVAGVAAASRAPHRTARPIPARRRPR